MACAHGHHEASTSIRRRWLAEQDEIWTGTLDVHLYTNSGLAVGRHDNTSNSHEMRTRQDEIFDLATLTRRQRDGLSGLRCRARIVEWRWQRFTRLTLQVRAEEERPRWQT